jgi:hypothetical protein
MFAKVSSLLVLAALMGVLAITASGSLPPTTANADAAAAASDSDDTMVIRNKTPKSTHLFTDACTECQAVIGKLADVVDDPEKLMELKAILTVLCHETSYETECKMFVSKLDLFIDKLRPFLKHPVTVCRWMHICGNTKLEQFHRVGMLYAKKYVNRVQGAKDLICEECQFAAHQLQQLIDDPTYQTEAKEWLSANVCARMGHYRGACDEVLEQVLPDFWQELHDMLKDSKQFCVDIDLCESTVERVLVSRPVITTTSHRHSESSSPTQQAQTPVQNAQPSQQSAARDSTSGGSGGGGQHKVSKRVISALFPENDNDDDE